MPASSASSAPPKKRAALYLRISTRDGRQTEENQRRQLRRFIEGEGYALAEEFVDHESGRKGRRERQAFGRMFEAAERREFDTLVFWSPQAASAVRVSARRWPTCSSSRPSACAFAPSPSRISPPRTSW